ncbi:glycosyltransferase family 4 protein [Algibacter sp. 2305UL17-15]|uniref:glycosyltransferase family 4 protein n=1 Tax=Algibacter sp. 2305UL17-15 TaxID=3231268 RepID=UPI003457B132
MRYNGGTGKKHMKNILYIGNQLSQMDKTETTIDTLSRLLRSENFDVITASRKANKLMRLLDMLFHIAKNRNNVDYVLIDTYSTSNFYYAYLSSRLCRFFKLKYIPILHGGNLPERIKKSSKLSKQLFDNAYVNVAPSLYLMTNFEKAGFKNLVYIPNTIELKNYKFEKRTIKTIKLLWVRSFSKLYNPKLAVKILKALKDENINASLCMIGPDNDGSLIETKALAKQLKLDVQFTGKLTKTAWHKKAEAHTIFINTTNIDNTPVSVIEAMALGLPVISTNVGGLPFLIDNGVDGVLVAPDNTEVFKSEILNLIHDKDYLNEIVNNARKKVAQFDWEVVKQKWFSILS